MNRGLVARPLSMRLAETRAPVDKAIAERLVGDAWNPSVRPMLH